MNLALRRAKGDVREMTIDPAEQWKSEDYDTGETWGVSGKQIREEGFRITIPNRRDSRLIFHSANHADTP